MLLWLSKASQQTHTFVQYQTYEPNNVKWELFQRLLLLYTHSVDKLSLSSRRLRRS